MRLGDRNFFNVFALIAGSADPHKTRHQWQADGVSWTRERMARQGPTYSVQAEIFTLSHGGKSGWTLLLVHETWWDENKRKTFRNARWVHLVSGMRADVVKWFSARQAAIENNTK